MLSSIRVLDLTDDRGHLAGLLFAQVGAEVLHVEPPGGHRHRQIGPFAGDVADHDRALSHLATDRGKSSVVCGAAGQIVALARTADVVIDCGVFERIGLDLAGLRAVNPGLVTVSITPFGEDGPKAEWPATDLTIAASSGTMSMTGDSDRAPVRVGSPQTWNYAASDAVCAALAALRERRRSGAGQHIDVSAQLSFLTASQFQMMYGLRGDGSESPQRIPGGVQLGDLVIQYVHACLDGHVTVTFLFGAMVGPYSMRLFEWMTEEGECPEHLQTEDWVEYANRVLTGERSFETLLEATQVISDFCASRTKAELLGTALERNLLIAPIATTADVLELEHLHVRGYWDSLEVDGHGAVAAPGPMARPSRVPLPTLPPAPRLGAHTEEVFAALEERSAPAWAESSSSEAPLAGLKVLDFMWALAGPGSTRMLADLGATVVKVESETHPDILRGVGPFVDEDGDSEGAFQFHSLNAGKLGLAIDMKRPEAIEVLEDLVRWADVVTDSFSAGAMARFGLGYDRLKELNPRVIQLSSCLMGASGPMARYAGFGTMAAAIAGFYPITGWADRLPSGPFSAFTDYISPRLTVIMLLAALEERERSGEGQFIDYSQLEGALHFLGAELLDQSVNGRTATRRGNRDPHMAPHGVYRCTGGDDWVAVACETDDQWRALAGLIGADDLAELGVVSRFDRHDHIDDLIGEWASTRSHGEAEAELIAAGVPAHRIHRASTIVHDPQMLHREAFVQVEHAQHGTSWVENQPFRFSRTPIRQTHAAPTFGQHSFSILTELLGYDIDRFTDLAVADVLK